MIVNLLDIYIYMSPTLCQLIAICTKTQLVMGALKTCDDVCMLYEIIEEV